jgi:putative ubiquitin-RnfH superfamily antitoxin RatB of RatAB toxin-antitoxin module
VTPPTIRVQIVFAQPEAARQLELNLPAGATVGVALEAAARSAQFTEVPLTVACVGIFGRVVGHEQVLKTGDRVEIYRPLAADPKTARRKRVASKSGRS